MGCVVESVWEEDREVDRGREEGREIEKRISFTKPTLTFVILLTQFFDSYLHSFL